ncbi:MAG: PD-(D/E)XK nuclease family protein [Deltaproteobacteria bacterium]|nr:PD-(D/E)XK nuclease family protein [Deltaproteobacteria bacterium]
MSRAVLVSPSAEQRLERAAAWLAARPERHVTIVGASIEASAEIARRALAARGGRASFGWQRSTLGVLAVGLARPELARRGLVPVGGLALEAACARIVHAAHRKRGGSALGRFAPIGDRPGLPRALARTVQELRLAGEPDLHDADLTKLLRAFEKELDAAGLADRARVLAIAKETAAKADPDEIGALLFVDVPLRTHAERDFLHALAKRAPAALAILPSGDDRAESLFRAALDVATPEIVAPSASAEGASAGGAKRAGDPTLARLQTELFGDGPLTPSPSEGEAVTILSAPGESRECVELARIVLEEAARGTRLDRIAVLLRAPQYGAHVEEALHRAGVPTWFARGTRMPDPAGRAMLALLACAAEGLSARRFAEYLSLGEVPDDDGSGAPPPAPPPGDRIAPPDEETADALLGRSAAVLGELEEEEESLAREERAAKEGAEEDRATVLGTLRAPRHWERLLGDAAVLGGKERWEKRLAGHREKLLSDLATWKAKGEEAPAAGVERDLAALDSLRRFAIPLVAELALLPSSAEGAPWGAWLDGLEKLATRALRRPDRVLAVLSELRPMAKVGPVGIREVRLVLEPRLSQLVVRPTGRRYGSVYIATIEEARGLSFDVVFVPGLAEKIFPQKVVEDPLLLDGARAKLEGGLPTNEQRSAEERLALRLAIGAAARRVVLSYPRLDVEQARPRTPSFYGLEVLRVVEGKLGDFEHLAARAARKADARIGWPAPATPASAIDEAEYDLALLRSILEKREEDAVGEAHYLLNANPHLARALRFRGRRWLKSWKAADGIVDPPGEALAAIREHMLDKRSYSPTALQNFAACPYRFYLSAVLKLAPREELAPIEDLDPLTRGSLTHEVMYELLTRLHAKELLPVTRPRLEEARAILEDVLGAVAARERDRLSPAIDRVWDDAIAGIAADLREWLRRMTEEPDWTPAHFELSFGLKEPRAQDAMSKDDAVTIEAGIQLRGSIDLVEKNDAGRLRATDYKTGKVRAKKGDVIAKGEILQPVFYALVLERLFTGGKVDGGRLYYCTTAGDFTKIDIPLDDQARAAARVVAKTVGDAVAVGFLPTAPAKDACRYCDYRPVCGPYEEIRTKRKPADRLKDLVALRRQK